jgi:hypothetical protein
MRNTLQQATRAQRANVVDLFEEQAPMHGAQLRAREQQERLAKDPGKNNFGVYAGMN